MGFGVKSGDRVADCFPVAVFALETETRIPGPRLGRYECKGAPSFAMGCLCVVEDLHLDQMRTLFSNLPRRSSLAAVLSQPGASGLQRALAGIWRAVREQELYFRATSKTAVRDQIKRFAAFSKALQRCTARPGHVHLGFSDLEEWRMREDTCLLAGPKGMRSLGELLEFQCRCGAVSFRRGRQTRIGDIVPTRDWGPYVIHQLKGSFCS